MDRANFETEPLVHNYEPEVALQLHEGVAETSASRFMHTARNSRVSRTLVALGAAGALGVAAETAVGATPSSGDIGAACIADPANPTGPKLVEATFSLNNAPGIDNGDVQVNITEEGANVDPAFGGQIYFSDIRGLLSPFREGNGTGTTTPAWVEGQPFVGKTTYTDIAPKGNFKINPEFLLRASDGQWTHVGPLQPIELNCNPDSVTENPPVITGPGPAPTPPPVAPKVCEVPKLVASFKHLSGAKWVLKLALGLNGDGRISALGNFADPKGAKTAAGYTVKLSPNAKTAKNRFYNPKSKHLDLRTDAFTGHNSTTSLPFVLKKSKARQQKISASVNLTVPGNAHLNCETPLRQTAKKALTAKGK